MNVFFDVQGTLLSAGTARPGVREALERLVEGGHDVYLWSSAGAGYAREAAESLGLMDLVLGCYSKGADPPVEVEFTVDDHPGIRGRRGSYAIPPFTGDPGDREMERVAEHLLR